MADYLGSKNIAAAVAAYEASNGSIAPGETVHVDHDGCTAGEDTRQRLYITRKTTDTGGVSDLAYCHNCGKGGVSRPSISFARPKVVPRGTKPALPARALELPASMIPPATPDFPAPAFEFLMAGQRTPRLTGTQLVSLGVGYDRESARLILPIYGTVTGEGGDVLAAEPVLGWQARRLYGKGPKYLTVESDAAAAGDGLEMEFDLWHDRPASDCAILVEDWLSAAYVASECPRATVIPLLRYKISAERLARLRKRFKHLGVWLDDDKPEVIATRDYLKRLWASMGGSSGHAGAGTDPKHWSEADLHDSYATFRSMRGLDAVVFP